MKMAKAILDSLDGLSDVLKAEYFKVEQGHPLASKHLGKFALKVDPVDGIAMEDVASLKNALSATRTERDEARSKVTALGEGFDVEAAKKALARIKELEGKDPTEQVKEQIEAAKRQLVEKFGKTESELKATISQRDAEIESLMVDAVATAAINEHKGSVKLLLPAVRSNCKVVRGTDGKPTVHVLQADGKTVRLSNKQGNNDNMTIGEFIETLKTDDSYKPAFQAIEAKGTGAGKGNNNGKQKNQNQNNSDGNGNEPPANQPGKDMNFVEQLKEQRRVEAGTA